MRIPVIATNFLLFPLSLALTGCGKPYLDVDPSLTTIGQTTSVAVHVHDPHGVNKLSATLAQGGKQYQAWQATAPSKNADTTFNFNVGTRISPQLLDGTARLIIEATSGGPFHRTAHWEREVSVPVEKLRGKTPPANFGDFHGFSHGMGSGANSEMVGMDGDNGPG